MLKPDRKNLFQEHRLKALAAPTWLIACAAAFVTAAASNAPITGQQSTQSIQSTMDGTIDPAADALWAAVGTTETRSGTVHRVPNGDAAWRVLQDHARTLITGARHLTRAKLPVGGDGHSALADASIPGTRTAAQIRADIDRNPARFQTAAVKLERAARRALQATISHDPDRLVVAGAAIDAACESCHAAYWYPRGRTVPLPSAARFGAIASRP